MAPGWAEAQALEVSLTAQNPMAIAMPIPTCQHSSLSCSFDIGIGPQSAFDVQRLRNSIYCRHDCLNRRITTPSMA